ncbi:hypothetical protein ANO11243_012640 [Dothideomycetidae sp. 11243]|nr:hypothetical protein ANO11243_012640 [fungal sp. No.11243]
MADDTRRDTSLSAGYKPFEGDQWKDATATKRPEGPANIMPGGTANTAGGERPDDVAMVKAAKLIKWEDWTTLPSKPCVKDSLMTGIGSGFALGGLRAVLRAPVFSACNWARKAEREGMKQAMEIIDRKSIERKQKEQRMERARELRRQKKEQEDQEAFARLRTEKEHTQQQRSSWKFW